MSSSVNLEGLEMKEATPSIAPSIYETQYNKKWRVLVAVGIGASLMAFSILIFYLSSRSYRPSAELQAGLATIGGVKITDNKDLSRWRSLGDGVCISSQQEKCPTDYKTRPILLLALGGLSANQTSEIPALRKLIECGVKARSLVPSYPTYSYPNLYSIATGLYPETHGIVSNRIYDSVINLNFSIDSPIADDPAWWKGEPIWNTLTKQGRRTGAYLWPGFNVLIQDTLPTYSERDRLLFQTRMTKILNWLKLPEDERPHLIMMYYDEPEATAQKLGPYPTSVKAVLNRINDGIDQLMNSLRKENLINCVNVIVVSDHGMAPISCKNAIDINNIDDHRKEEYPIRMFPGPVSSMAFLKSADDKSRENVVRSLRCRNSNVKVMEKSQVPIRYHHTNNRRIGDLLLDSSVGHFVSRNVKMDCPGLQGASGYNNLDELMQGVFVAHGPSFKENFEIDSFRNIEIYNLICSMLNIKPSPNNGTIGSLESILIDNEGKEIENAPKAIFLEEKLQPRYKRPMDGVLDPKSDSSKCHCDRSHWKTPEESTTSSTTTTTPSTTTTSTTTTTSALTSTTTTTTTSTTTTTQVPSSSSSADISSSSVVTDLPASSTPKEELSEPLQNGNHSQSSSISQKEDTEGDERDLYSTVEVADELKTRKKRDAGDYVDDDERTLSELRDRHCPMGCPKFSAPEVSSDIVKVLHQSHYVIGLPASLNMGIWVSFTLTKNYIQELSKLRPSLPKDVYIAPEDIKQETIHGCWVADPRSSRSSSDQCGRSLQTDLYKSKNVTLMQLYPEELEEPDLLATEGFFLSNMAPLLWGFVEGGRKVMLKAIDKFVSKYNVVNVQHGPIFDFNFDGKKDNITEIRNTRKPLIPSNYFFIVTFCNSTDATEKSEATLISQCPINEKIVLSFSFPNVNTRDMCRMTESNYLKHHMANIADIEELSGNKFFQKLGKKQQAQLRSRQPVQITPFILL